MAENRLQRAVAGRLRLGRSGAVAMLVALMMPVMLGGLAFSMDGFLNRIALSRLQAAADAAAVQGLEALAAEQDPVAAAVASLPANLPSGYGQAIRAEDVVVGRFDANGQFVPDSGPDANAVRVWAERSPGRGNGVPQIISGIFGLQYASVSTMAIAARPLNVFYEPPEAINLDNEAGDFNEMYAYCFDFAGSGSAASRRTKMTLIANNLPAGTDVGTFTSGVITENPNPNDGNWPRCDEESQSLSFRMRNIRHAKSNPQLWRTPNARIDNRRPGRPEFNYFTDTVLSDGVEQFDSSIRSLETIRCDSQAQCTPGQPGNIIPSGRNRTPRVSTLPCQPGKFMYFGWEDRPPGQSGAAGNWLDPAWTDRDFDDIRIIMRCPRSGRLGESKVRLVR